MIYATRDTDGGRAAENAKIRAFETETAARTWLLAGYGDEWDKAGATVGPVSWADCWIKLYAQPGNDIDTAPFAAGDLIVQAPGSHPGGRQWWITPSETVLGVTSISEVDD